MEPLIDQTAASSHMVKVNSMTLWKITAKGEPPPSFSWHKAGQRLVSGEEVTIQREEAQGAAVSTLHIHRTRMRDAGTYTLTAENKNGEARVDLDLRVFDTVAECRCDPGGGSGDCQCFNSFNGNKN